jgi:sortase A
VRERVRRALGIGCAALGAALLLYAASVTAAAAAWQARAARRSAAVAAPGPDHADSAVARGRPLGRLRIERLGIDVMVAEGSDRRTLLRGPGHLEGSALPGEPDNCIIAGHRDGAFRRLGGARPGDRVEIATGGGTARYRVDAITIVDRDDASPLAPADRAILTLVTCHPFRYVGPAPRRFIVRASLID